MDFVKSLSMFHVDAKEIPCVTGNGAPTEKTEGAPGALYMDTLTGELYKCRVADLVHEVFTWEAQEGSGYKLPIGGTQLGGVKNGGNVTINADGTMTAPEAGSIKITGTENSKIAPTGTILDNGTEIHLVSQEIRVNPGEQYLLTCSANFGNSLYAIYDSNGGMKENLTAPATEEGRNEVDLQVTIPSDGAILRVAWNKQVTDTPYAVTKVGNAVAIPKVLDGVTVAVIGDSLVEKNNSARVNFVDLIAAETGATITNLGVGGTGYMARADEGKAFYQRAEQIPDGTERVLIYGSGNDRDMELGTPADTGTDTLCGCINATIDAVYERVPTAWVGIIAPAPWKEYPPYGEKRQFELMVQAQQRICARRGIPFLDLYHASGLRPWDDTFRELAFDAEGVHPNDTGHALIAPQIQAFLLGAVGGGAVASVPDSSGKGDTLLVSYTHTANLELYPTAFDRETGVFTCAGHGLGDYNPVIIIPSQSATYDKAKLPGVISAELVVDDADTFSVRNWDHAADTNIGTIDISAFHFEKVVLFNIVDIPVHHKMRVEITAKMVSTSWTNLDCSILSSKKLEFADNGSFSDWGRMGYSLEDARGIYRIVSNIEISDSGIYADRIGIRADPSGGNAQFQRYVCVCNLPDNLDTMSIKFWHSGSSSGQGIANGCTVKVYGVN